MAALLVALAVMAVVASAAMPVWQTSARREREAELVFRGEQYARAIALFQRKYANALPPTLDVLINEKFLRKKYADPITNGEFQLLGAAQAAAGSATQTGRTGGTPATANPSQTVGTPARGTGQIVGGIMGVTSRSAQKSLRLYNGRGAYNEWAFVPVQRQLGPTAPGAGQAGSAVPNGGRGLGSQPVGRGLGTQGGRGLQPPGGAGGGRGSGLGPPPFGRPGTLGQ